MLTPINLDHWPTLAVWVVMLCFLSVASGFVDSTIHHLNSIGMKLFGKENMVRSGLQKLGEWHKREFPRSPPSRWSKLTGALIGFLMAPPVTIASCVVLIAAGVYHKGPFLTL